MPGGVDKGGLNYKVDTGYDAGPLNQFLADLDAIDKAATRAQASVSKLRKPPTAGAATSTAAAAASPQNPAAAQGLNVIAAAQARLAKATQLATNASITQAKTQLTTLQTLQRAQITAARNQALFAQGLNSRGAPIAPAQVTVGGKNLAAASAGMQKLKKNTDDTTESTNRLLQALKRVVTIAVAFAAFRTVKDYIIGATTEAIEFNARIEQAEIGIAAVVSAVAEIRDAQGKATEGAQAFVLAQAAARKQVAALRKDAVLTAASFEDLVQTFQTGIAPGLQAGLNLDQIRVFTRQISQAAAAIELPQNQLAEEIRSILSGTIQVRQTRIAAALGITNEDIKRAKEAGTLFEFLQKRFQSFDVAGQRARLTISGLIERIKDAGQAVLGEGGKGLFLDFKEFLKETLGELATLNDITGNVEFNPRFVAAIKEVADAFKFVLNEGRRFKDFLLGGDIEGGAKKLAGQIKIFAAGFEGFLEGLIEGIKLFASFIPGINLGVGTTRDIVKQITKYLTTLFLAKQAKDFGKDIFGNLKNGLDTVLKFGPALASFTSGPLGTAISKFGIWGAAIAAVAVALDQVYQYLSGNKSILGIDTAIFDTKPAREFAKALNTSEGSLRKFAALARGTTDEELQAIEDEIKLRNKSIDDQEIARKRQADFNKDLRAFSQDQRKDFTKTAEDTLKIFDSLNNSQLEASSAVATQVDRELATLKGPVLAALQQIEAASKELDLVSPDRVQEMKTNLREALVAYQQGVEALSGRLESVILGPSKAIDDLREKIGELGKSLGALKDETADKQAVIGLSSDVGDIVSTGLRARTQTESQLFDIQREREATLLRLKVAQDRVDASGVDGLLKQLGLLERKEGLEERIMRVSKEAAEQGKDFAQFGLAESESRLSAIRSEIADTLQKINELTVNGRPALLVKAEVESLNARLEELRKTEAEFRSFAAQGSGEEVIQKANQFAFDKRIANASLQIEAANARLLTIYGLQGNQMKVNLLVKQQELDLARVVNSQANDAFQKNVEGIKQQIDALKALDEEANRGRFGVERTDIFASQIDSLQTVLDLLEQEHSLQQQIRDEEIKRLEVETERAAIRSDGGINAQILESFAELERELPSRFENIKQLAADSIGGLTDLISSSIVDAFDPSKDMDIKQRFGEFLAGMAQEVISMFVRIALIKAALGLAGIFGASDGGGINEWQAASGFARGGRAKGYADGGKAEGPYVPHLRPAGLDSRDNIPVWVRRDEYMHRPEAGYKLGFDAMEVINSLDFDPLQVRAALGLGARAVTSAGRHRGAGFASGGQVTSVNASPVAAATSPSLVGAVLLADDTTAETILSQGRTGAVRLLEEWGFQRR